MNKQMPRWQSTKEKRPAKKNVCRICLEEEDSNDENKTKTNPLIAPCLCNGSAQYIHLKCLKEWLKSKLVVNDKTYSKNYIYKVSKCELCQATYPDCIRIDGKKHEIFEFERPKRHQYAILEVLGLP